MEEVVKDNRQRRQVGRKGGNKITNGRVLEKQWTSHHPAVASERSLKLLLASCDEATWLPVPSLTCLLIQKGTNNSVCVRVCKALYCLLTNYQRSKTEESKTGQPRREKQDAEKEKKAKI